ncbi:hypothetical protein [Caballeronia arvi]|uniref:hypothetical protein n=1 Tax=Caballeronia arvi TaxID=1777135 RepID=UPI00135B535F|nr:hypothetical protein [Caballeronia arvi]
MTIAPALQLAADSKMLVNTRPYDDAYVLQANLIYTAFIISYLTSRFLLAFDFSTKIFHSRPRLKLRYFSLIPALTACTIAAVSAFSFAQNSQPPYAEMADITPLDMIRGKFFFFLIVPVFIVIVSHRPQRIGPLWIMLALFAFALLCLCENPLTEKRNALGPIYLTLVFLCLRTWLETAPRTFWSIFLLSGLFFPIAELFTHTKVEDWSMATSSAKSFYEQHFTSISYDAWANTVAVVEIVNAEGFYWGKQVAGAILFFVPHTVWSDKPLSTGILIGEFLSGNYSMWFVNLSAPLPAEGYLDFGWAGVVLYGVLLGSVSRCIDALLDSSPLWRAMGLYLSFYMVFLLRGALMVAVAYVVPVLLTFYLVSVLLVSREKKVENGDRANMPV